MRRSLIIPAAGKSSRYPNMKPKWLLTHPDGRLMIDKIITDNYYHHYDKIIISILQEHIDKYEADIILDQIFGSTVQINVIDTPTKSAGETVYKTILAQNVTGPVTIKDSDNIVTYTQPNNDNFIVGLNIEKVSINKPESKSFVIKTDDDLIEDIIEKKIVSKNICVGVYSVDSAEMCSKTYEHIIKSPLMLDQREVYVSHILSLYMNSNKEHFDYVECDNFIDWSTIDEWRSEQLRHTTYFVDIDGVIVKNVGKYGSKNWSNSNDIISTNIECLKRLYDRGGQIILTTSRVAEYTDGVVDMLRQSGILIHDIVNECNHAKRVIINDFAPTNPYPSCEAVSLERNDDISKFIK